MQIFLGEHTNKKNFGYLINSLKVPLTFYTTHKKNLSCHPQCILSSEINDSHQQIIFMPNKEEKKIAKQKKILYYTYQPQNLLKNQIKKMRNIFLNCIDFLIQDKPTSKRNIILIKTDAIGDYLLFRNFLQPLYKHYGKITLVANQSNIHLIQTFDQDFLLDCIFIDRKKILQNPFYRFKLIKKLKQHSYKLLINPLYSRDNISEQIVKNIIAEEKITSEGNTSNLTFREKSIYDQLYTKIFPSSPKVLFEFKRNQEFFENLLNQKLQVEYYLDLKDTTLPYQIPQPYVTFFIGASMNYRKWNNEHFIKVGKFLIQKGYHIAICGGKEDAINGDMIVQVLSHQNATNLCGKTSLSALAQVVYNGNHLLSNETSCVHIAQAIRHNKVFVVSNGNHLHRFTPYPKGLGGKYYGVYHTIIQQNFDAYVLLSNYLINQSQLNINQISAEDVILTIQNTL